MSDSSGEDSDETLSLQETQLKLLKSRNIADDKTDGSSTTDTSNRKKGKISRIVNKQTNVDKQSDVNKQDMAEQNNLQEKESSEDDFLKLFNSRAPVMRTPPRSECFTENDNNPKRPRSESTPPESTRTKIAKHILLDGTEDKFNYIINNEHKANNHMSNDITKNEHGNSNGTTRSFFDDILKNLQVIHNVTDKRVIEQSDVSEIRKASFDLHLIVTTLAFSVGKLEAEVTLGLQNRTSTNNFQITNAPRASTQNISEYDEFPKLPVQVTRKKTYSSVVTTKGNTVEKDKVWITPPTGKKIETMIKPKNPKHTIDILKTVKPLLNNHGTKETFKNVRHLQNGGVVVQCESD